VRTGEHSLDGLDLRDRHLVIGAVGQTDPVHETPHPGVVGLLDGNARADNGQRSGSEQYLATGGHGPMLARACDYR
jgi:hypothetical protein